MRGAFGLLPLALLVLRNVLPLTVNWTDLFILTSGDSASLHR